MQCCKCQRTIPERSEFCSYCGTKQENAFYCRKCGEKIPADSEFCQYCGASTSIQSSNPTPVPPQIIQKNSPHIKKRRLWIFLALAIAVIVIAIVLIVALPLFSQNESRNTEEVVTESIEDKIATSQYLGIMQFKDSYSSYEGDNLHISGYVLEGPPNDRVIGITVVESPDTPNNIYNYFELADTPLVYVELLPDGQCTQVPRVGDYVDVFFVGDGRVKVSAYCIKIH